MLRVDIAAILLPITERSRQFMDIFTARKDYMAFYSDDCRLYVPDQETAIGKGEVTEAFKEIEKKYHSAKILRIVEFLPLTEDLAWVNAEGQFFGPQGEICANYKSTALWRRVAEIWYVHRDMWNIRPVSK